MSIKENIFVIGYPKSGNTWLARLIAEITNSTIETVNNDDIVNGADNNGDRTGNYLIKKIHNTVNQDEIQKAKCVYIIRDPRAVFVSGFFHKHRNIDEDLINDNIWHRIFFNYEIMRLNQGWSNNLKARINILKKYLLIKKSNRKISIKDIIIPPAGIGNWSQHVEYWERDETILIVKYEDLLENTEQELKLILEYLNIQISNLIIQTVIANQSFDSKKKEFTEKGDNKNVKFLRSGKKDNWKRLLGKKLQNKIEKKHMKQMIKYEYYD